MFGLGFQELLVLAIFGGLPVAAVLVALFVVRRGGGRVAELEAENRRLREQLDQKSSRA
jgi:hypothetical protein